ncbi:MAG TPA: CAP domain-containing protein, partial [Kofleriaceae bacterium]|nr:CAP domain-containing protein [Kofleriaceae bacterium]
AHNQVRAKHCATPLQWSPQLAQVAQQWANSLRDQGCKFGHSGGRYGENLAAGTSGTLDGQSVTGMWYDEVKQYAFPDGGFSMQTGHFTQVVWRESTQLGCAVSTCRGMDIWVCEYDPPGNVQGMFRQNVQPAGCR